VGGKRSVEMWKNNVGVTSATIFS